MAGKLSNLFQGELKRLSRKVKVGDKKLCVKCGQTLGAVEGIDTELYLQTGKLIVSGMAFIHESQEASAKCRGWRGDPAWQRWPDLFND